jgi:hypothetical protein
MNIKIPTVLTTANITNTSLTELATANTSSWEEECSYLPLDIILADTQHFLNHFWDGV